VRHLGTQLESSVGFPTFVPMQIQVDIAFDQLLKVVKKLPAAQLRQLKGLTAILADR